MTLIGRIVLAVVVAAIIGLACLLLGALLGDIHIEVASTVGDFLRQWGFVIGLLAGLWYFFTHGGVSP